MRILFSICSGISFGSQKRSFDNGFNREMLDEIHSQNFNGEDGKNYETFYNEQLLDETNRYYY